MHRTGYSSRDDVSVNSFISSSGDASPFGDLDPRARSTSDLFEVPVGRIKPKLYKRSSTSSATCNPQNFQRTSRNLSLIPEQAQLPNLPSHTLTPYQKQRKRMKNSFQFPNGENFTPKQKPVKAFPSYTENTHRRGLPKSASCSNFHAGVDRPGFSVVPERPDPAVRSGSFTTATISSIPMPPTNRFHKSASTSRLSQEAMFRSNQAPTVLNTPSGRPPTHSSTRSAPTYLTSDSNNNLSKTQAVSSNNSTNSTNSMRSENVVSSNTSTDASEAPLKPVTAVKDVPPISHSLKPSLPARVLSAPKKAPVSTYAHTVTTKPTPLVKPVQKSPLGESDKQSVRNGLKRSSSSRISSFFRKLLPTKKSKKETVESRPAFFKRKTSSLAEAKLVETPSISVSRPSHSPSNENVTFSEKAEVKEVDMDDANDGDNEVDEFDDDDDQLLDIDLVFDSLLLKNDHPITTAPKARETPQQAISRDAEPSKPVDKNQTTTEESNIDYGLIEEFSRLGSFIADGYQPPENSLVMSPPPRSLRRPLLANKESVAGFYRKHSSENKTSDPDERLDANLKREWENVYYDTVIAIVAVHQQPVKEVQPKKLRFGQAVYVKDTYAANDYERSDKKFIRARRRMMQTQNMAFIQAVKHQLNDFKREEMKVHNESLKNTHYFL
ncbi:LAFA_0E06700g1_1 [Lachancea sp. 'fantastica']|nr:LAFA_0E06700g1_1 [Lachancea sp. 'fantastica']